MSTFVIGDVQGCYEDLIDLLSKVNFSPACDQVYLAGDLVNRGPRSLETLRFVYEHQHAIHTVLGNHDLHLLAQHHTGARPDKDFEPIFEAVDCDTLLRWLIKQPLMIRNSSLKGSLIHAGLAPSWTIEEALGYAAEVETLLSNSRVQSFFQGMYSNKPKKWSSSLSGTNRLRFIVNAFTRLRYCQPNGAMALNEKSSPSEHSDLIPWFQHPLRQSRGERIYFGHWSTLGNIHWPDENVFGMDSGCVWGGALSAYCVESSEITSAACKPHQTPK